MTVAKLISELQKIEDKTLPIRIVSDNSGIEELDNDEQNLWVDGLEASHTGASGYEISGEIRLIVQ